MIYTVRKAIIKLVKIILERKARNRILSNKELGSLLQTYLGKTKSTGCQYIDYDALYRYVRHWKPQEILECGTGASTVVLAYALMENEREGGKTGRITSMEEGQDWFDMANDLLPDLLKKYVDIRLSPIVEDGYMFYRGNRYAEVPDRQYDFVFTDGPSTCAPSDGTRTFDFDFLHIVRHSETPVGGLVDGRLTTCYVFQNILGPQKFKFDVFRNLGYIKPCTKNDLNNIKKNSSIALAHSKRILSKTRFYVKMELSTGAEKE
jgi:hypothetical protein